jgi:hypothetical protein
VWLTKWHGIGYFFEFIGVSFVNHFSTVALFPSASYPDHDAHYKILGLEVFGFISNLELGKITVVFVLGCTLKLSICPPV